MKYKTFVFDFDYTLADATPGIVQSVNYALNQAGLKSESHDEIKKTVGMTLEDMLYKLTGISDNQMANQFRFDFTQMADKVMTNNTILLEDTISVLSQLKQCGYNTAIVSTKYRYRINEILKKYSIPELIDYIIGYEDVETAKPSPEGLIKVIKHFGNDKTSVLYIGDSLIDANTAANASVDFAAVLTGTTKKEEFLCLPYICIAKTLTELTKFA